MLPAPVPPALASYINAATGLAGWVGEFDQSTRARYVVEHCPAPLYSPEPAEEDLVIFLGPDEHGVPLEVMGIELADGDLLVIHAMRLRPKYRDAFKQVMEWHEQ